MTKLNLAHAVHISNVWLLRDDENRAFLVDTGHFSERPILLAFLWKHGIRKPGDLTAILLTHRHSDHADNAASLRARFQCPVCIHAADAPILSGDQPAQRLRRGIGRLHDEVACAFEDRFPSRCIVDEAFTEGDFKWNFHIYRAAGHTEGSSFLYHAPSQTLFSGDVLLAGLPPLRFSEKLGPAMAAYSVDIDSAKQNLLDFLDHRPPLTAIAPGHGPLVTVDLEAKLDALRERVLASVAPLSA